MILRIRARAKIEAGQPQEPTHELGIPTYEMRPSAILETYYCEVVAVKELEYPHGGFIRTYDLKQSVGWICAGAAILPGVQIASGCVIAAGAVVTHSTAPNGLYAGIPAIRKKDL